MLSLGQQLWHLPFFHQCGTDIDMGYPEDIRAKDGVLWRDLLYVLSGDLHPLQVAAIACTVNSWPLTDQSDRGRGARNPWDSIES